MVERSSQDGSVELRDPLQGSKVILFSNATRGEDGEGDGFDDLPGSVQVGAGEHAIDGNIGIEKETGSMLLGVSGRLDHLSAGASLPAGDADFPVVGIDGDDEPFGAETGGQAGKKVHFFPGPSSNDDSCRSPSESLFDSRFGSESSAQLNRNLNAFCDSLQAGQGGRGAGERSV